MAYNKQLSQPYFGGSMDQSHNKVYINPNFKRDIRLAPHNSSMYFNPNFPQLSSTLQNNSKNKKKIYLNPNFIRHNNTNYNIGSTILNSAHCTNNCHVKNQIKSVQPLVENNIAAPAIIQTTKSRYSIVRHKNENRTAETYLTEKGTTTIKINKYKSVPFNDIKKKLAITKSLNKASKTITKASKGQLVMTKIYNNKNNVLSPMPNLYASRYKIVKQNEVSKSSNPNLEIKPFANRKLSVSFSRLQSNLRTKIKINKKHFKKNNIPCPLFRKYGKCLRHDHGNCEFMHDRKHVSICRRYLNGSCHENDCLLSHDVTLKKMPTCSFYLKGTCTKESCPYLHVKLNENTKICTDFLKGYCEKGDSCLNRHINLCPDMASKGTCLKKKCPYPHIINKTKTKKNIKLKTRILNRSYKSNLQRRHSKVETKNIVLEEDQNEVECRYYKEVTNSASNSVICEVIKPTRCKLGTLPSFIQLG